MENKEHVYSIDGNKYMSYEAMMCELRDYQNKGESVEVWEADKKEFMHTDFINVNDVIDNMQYLAMDECGEAAEEYLNELTEEQKANLEKHIAKWFNKNAKINFYGVENERKIVVIVE